jgi:hypothetical protein
MRAAWHCGSVAPIRADAARKAARFFASLCPRKYFIILPGQIANGFSSSPSNTPPPFNGGAFPHDHALRLQTNERQAAEVAIAVDLNRMLEQGRPSYVRIA